MSDLDYILGSQLPSWLIPGNYRHLGSKPPNRNAIYIPICEQTHLLKKYSQFKRRPEGASFVLWQIKLLPAMLASHRALVCVLATSLSIQLSANVSRKGLEDGPSVWAHMGDGEEAPQSLQPLGELSLTVTLPFKHLNYIFRHSWIPLHLKKNIQLQNQSSSNKRLNRINFIEQVSYFLPVLFSSIWKNYGDSAVGW